MTNKILNPFFLKRLALLILIIGSIFNIQGQGTLLDYEHRSSKIIDMLPISSDEYVVATKTSYEGTSVKWFKGDSVYKEHLILEDTDALKLALTDEGIIIEATSSLFECEWHIPSYRRFLLDTIQSERSIIYYPEFNLGTLARMTTLSNNNILRIDGFSNEPAEATGIILKSGEEILLDIEVPNNKMTNIVEIDERVYVYGYEYVLYTDIDGGELDTLFFERSNIKDIVKTNIQHQIAILTDYGVYIKTIGSDVEILYPLSQGDGAGKDIIFTDRLYLLRSYEEERNVVEVIDEEGNWETYAHLGLLNYEIDQLYDMAEYGIWIAGQFIIPDFSGYNGLYNYLGSAIIDNLERSSDESNDIGLDVINIEGDGEQKVDFTFRVTNNSNQYLEDIKVYSTPINIYWCEFHNLDFTIDKLNANSDTTIETSMILNFGAFDGTVCVYVLGSGENPDLDMEDNIVCMQVTNTNELSPIADGTIYPNPAINILRSKSAQLNDIFELVDLQGRLIKRINYNNGINISDINPGFYFARNLKNQEVSKFMKL